MFRDFKTGLEIVWKCQWTQCQSKQKMFNVAKRLDHKKCISEESMYCSVVAQNVFQGMC